MTRAGENTPKTHVNFITIHFERQKREGGERTRGSDAENAQVQETCGFSALGLAMTRDGENTPETLLNLMTIYF